MADYPEDWQAAFEIAYQIFLSVESVGYRLDHRRYSKQSALNQLDAAIEHAERLLPIMLELREQLTVEMAIDRMADVSCGD